MTAIFSLLLTVAAIVAVWAIIVGIIGVSLGIIKFLLPVIIPTVVGGLIGYMIGGTEKAVINGMIVGGGLIVLIYVCHLVESFAIFKLIFWVCLGVLLGSFLNMMVIFGIIGLAIGLYRMA